MQYVDMDDIRRRHRGYWFTPGAMRFFRSRVGSFGYLSADGTRVYFVSSEQYEDPRGIGLRQARLYTVRVQDLATGDIDTVGAFQQYASRSGADRAAQRLAGG